MTKLKCRRAVPATVYVLLGTFMLISLGLVPAMEASLASHCDTSTLSCDSAISSFSQSPHGIIGATHGASPDDCPECEMKGHCSICPSSGLASTLFGHDFAPDSLTWRPGFTSSPVEVQSAPPERPPQT